MSVNFLFSTFWTISAGLKVSMGQVFLITIQYLLKRLEGIDESKWEEVIAAYDNMCNLDKLP